MQLAPNTVHVWTASLSISEEQSLSMLTIFSKDEQERAMRFRFPVHRLRYVATHYILRRIISLYTGTTPKSLEFDHTEYKKPYLKTPKDTQLHFNLSHSEDMALYAFTLENPLGIDIEKVKDKYNFDVSDRFFSTAEQDQLAKYSDNEQRDAFFCLWARKEAIIKAIEELGYMAK